MDMKELPNTDTHKCFACSPINPSGLQMKFYTNEQSVFTWITVPDHLCGWNNLVHGGILSTILDEVMSWTAMYLLKHITMTRSMAVEFLKPVSVGHRLKAEGSVKELKRKRNVLMEGSIYDADGDRCAKSTAAFALLSPAVAKRMGVMDEASLEWFERVINV